MKRLHLLIAVIATMASQLAYAQNAIDCSGTEVDDKGEPIIGATVQIPGTAVGTATDLDGKFSVKVPGNAKEINVSALG